MDINLISAISCSYDVREFMSNYIKKLCNDCLESNTWVRYISVHFSVLLNKPCPGKKAPMTPIEPNLQTVYWCILLILFNKVQNMGDKSSVNFTTKIHRSFTKWEITYKEQRVILAFTIIRPFLTMFDYFFDYFWAQQISGHPKN